MAAEWPEADVALVHTNRGKETDIQNKDGSGIKMRDALADEVVACGFRKADDVGGLVTEP